MLETQWTDEMLDGKRLITDPVADQVVQAFYDERDIEAQTLMRALVSQLEIANEDQSPAIASYLAETPALPPWADQQKIERGQRFFARWGLEACLALACASLPACYAGAKGVQVLHLTARLVTDPKRRLIETAQMVIDVMDKGGLEPHGNGYRDIRRVRLMHAGVRYLIRNDPKVAKTCDPPADGHYWCDDWGHPINQEDMAGTLLSFSVSILRALERLGIPISEEDQDAYLHSWNVAGYLMGIDEDLIAHDITSANLLFDTIFARQTARSDAGVEMTKALVEFIQQESPGRFLDGLGPTLIRHLISDQTADILEVPPSDWTRFFFGVGSRILRAIALGNAHSRILRWLARRGAIAIISGALKHERGPGRPAFDIPEHLATAWDLPDLVLRPEKPLGGDA